MEPVDYPGHAHEGRALHSRQPRRMRVDLACLRLLHRLLGHLRELHPVRLTQPQTSTPPRTHKLTIFLRAGNDIAALMPRYITVKRGFFICAGKDAYAPTRTR